MRTSEKSWAEQAWIGLHEVLGSNGANDVGAEWKEFNSIQKPVVTIFGSYDSGKSTLLKRLLVDDGIEIPPWLTVSARRETFEIRDVEGLGCLLRDTPGVAGGSSEHEQIVLDVLSKSDVILLILPPQLLTGDKELILSVVSGKAFRKQGLPLGDALWTAICKLDEGGYDPGDDLHAYESYAERKRKEWFDILKCNDLVFKEELAFAVSADPFQAVGNKTAPEPEDYNPHRNWDGIQPLIIALRGLRGRLNTMRSASECRFLCSRMENLCAAMNRRKDDIGPALDEAKSNHERFKLLEDQLDALLGAARSALDGAVEQELLSVARSRIETVEAVESFVTPRLHNSISLWWNDQTVALQKLLDEAETEIKTRDKSAGGLHSRKVLGAEEPDAQGAKGERTIPKKELESLFTKAQQALRDHHESKLGMKLQKAREELQKLEEAKSFSSYAKAAGGRKSFRTLAEAERAKRIVGVHAIIGTLGPTVIELGALLLEEAQKHKEERERVKRRTILRDSIRRVASDIALAAWKEWVETADEMRTWLDLHSQSAKSSTEALSSESDLLKRSLQTLGRLLEGL